MIKTVVKKENGKTSYTFMDEQEIKVLKRKYTNSCSRCENGYASKCEKMDCESTHNILDYDFITDGYQVLDGENELGEIIIKKCRNFEKDHPRVKPRTAEELKALRCLKESIMILYFDASDIDEALKIQDDLRNRGQLIDYDSINDRNKVLKK